jgi:hypothetical protein
MPVALFIGVDKSVPKMPGPVPTLWPRLPHVPRSGCEKAAIGETAVVETSSELSRLLADVFPLYLKTKNSHWHMSGPNFRDYRLLLDEHADQIFAMTDDIAERAAKSAGRRCAPSATSPVSGGSRTMTKAPSHQKRC